MPLNLYNDLIQKFGETINFPDLGLNEENHTCLQFDDTIVHFEYDENDDNLTLHCKLGQLYEPENTQHLQALLAGNLFWAGTKGATIGIEPNHANIFIMLQISLSSTHYPPFEKLVEQFVEAAIMWQNKITEWNEIEPDSNSGDENPPEDKFNHLI